MIAVPRTRGFSAGHRQIFLTNNNPVDGQRFIFCREGKRRPVAIFPEYYPPIE